MTSEHDDPIVTRELALTVAEDNMYYCDMCRGYHVQCAGCGAIMNGDTSEEIADDLINDYRVYGAWHLIGAEVFCFACVRKAV